eukprot:4616665-Pleurochrysis_carterae.AAC.3
MSRRMKLGRLCDTAHYGLAWPRDIAATMATLNEIEDGLCRGVFGADANADTQQLMGWLQANCFALAIRAAAPLSTACKHVMARSCSNGNDEAILSATYVAARLLWSSEFAFSSSKVECDSNPFSTWIAAMWTM